MKYKLKMAVPEMRPGEDKLGYLKRLEKIANERMRQIEKRAGEPELKGIKGMAYRKAVGEIMTAQGPIVGNPRFTLKGITRNKNGQYSQKSLQARINMVSRFLGSASSSIREFKKTVSRSVNTLNRRYHTDMGVSEWERIFDDKNFEELKKKLGSDVVVQAIAIGSRISETRLRKILQKDKMVRVMYVEEKFNIGGTKEEKEAYKKWKEEKQHRIDEVASEMVTDALKDKDVQMLIYGKVITE